MPTTPEEILRKKEVPRGSTIWELASSNRDMVDENIFWEIREGQTTRFWEEAWQQRGKMLELQEIQDIYKEGIARGFILVKDYQKEGQENEEWREWKKLE